MPVKVSSENRGGSGYETWVTNYITSQKRHYVLHLSGEQVLMSVKNEMGGCWKAQE